MKIIGCLYLCLLAKCGTTALFNQNYFIMKGKTSYKDAFDLSAAPIQCPHRYDVRSEITDQERKVEVLPTEKPGVSLVRWSYQGTNYEEEYRLYIRLDKGSNPKPDGSGSWSNGRHVRLRFYKPAR